MSILEAKPEGFLYLLNGWMCRPLPRSAVFLLAMFAEFNLFARTLDVRVVADIAGRLGETSGVRDLHSHGPSGQSCGFG